MSWHELGKRDPSLCIYVIVTGCMVVAVAYFLCVARP